MMAPTRLWPMVGTSLFSWKGKARCALDLVLPRGSATGDESLGAFVRRRFGGEVLERSSSRSSAASTRETRTPSA